MLAGETSIICGMSSCSDRKIHTLIVIKLTDRPHPQGTDLTVGLGNLVFAKTFVVSSSMFSTTLFDASLTLDCDEIPCLG